jgi:glycerol-3-phosphate dehydrogenase (NAD(P)+)
MTDADVALFGSGSWGTALAVHLAQNGRRVALWGRRPDAIATMRRTRRNPSYLPEAELPEAVSLTDDLGAAAAAARLWGLAVPSHALRSVAERLAPHLTAATVAVSLAKGIENDSLQTMTQVMREALPNHPAGHIGVLSGPSHAEEVAASRPTTVVAAAPTLKTAALIQDAFMTPRLRVYTSVDVRGVELGGAAKNVLAIAAGISDGVGYGDNAKAALVTRGLAEMRRLGRVLGADLHTFAGLTGIGDLVVTCMSPHSRNRSLGEHLGQGWTLDDALDDLKMVAEGVRTTRSIHDLAQHHGIEMPITEAVYAVLFENASPHDMVDELMTRAPKHEHPLASPHRSDEAVETSNGGAPSGSFEPHASGS